MQCWMNGTYMAASELRISPFDHGFLYGLGFFETFRTYEGKVLFFEEHMERLLAALEQHHIEMPYTPADLLAVIASLNAQADGQDGYFRLNVSAGEHGIGLQPTAYTQPNVILFRKDLHTVPRGQEKTAQWLKIRRNSPENALRVKSHHYGNNVLGRFEVASLAMLEGFFLTAEDYVAEGVTSNIFWVKNDILYTPSLETGILPGITRKWLMETVKALDLQMCEGLFMKQDVEAATECFITNSVQELVPIRQLGDIQFKGNQGPVYQHLHELYVEEIEQLHKER